MLIENTQSFLGRLIKSGTLRSNNTIFTTQLKISIKKHYFKEISSNKIITRQKLIF